ncbi:MAG: aminomethyltransferase family protein [Sphingopyxis sp.]|nr:aminomethyltransferase family protein [Sphingopyxis sp.]
MKSPLFKYRNLEEVLQAVGGPVKLLRSSQLGPYQFPVAAPEYTNWRDEQRAWKEGVALLNQSFHMTDLYLKGPDALKVLQKVGLTKMATFPVNRGKQLIAASPDGYLIGDGIVFHLEQDHFRVVGPPVISDWTQYHAETGGYDVEIDRDETVSLRPGEPRIWIYQIQGPHALALMQEVTDGTLPEIPFFGIGSFEIRGKKVRALRHGMAGEPGFEMFGPWEDQEAVMDALMEVGEKYNIKKVGSLAYPTTSMESGWMPHPVPAVYHTDEMKGFREWLPPQSLETLGSMGGSFYSDDIRDYYMDPIEVGYGPFIDPKRDDFIGKAALAERAANQRRKKVTLVWNHDDLMKVIHDSLYADPPARFVNFPLAAYSTFHIDDVQKNGRHIGVGQFSGFSANANEFITLAVVDMEHAEPGTQLTLMWGEETMPRPTIERNTLREVRVTVAPAPYFEKIIKKD